VTRASSVTDVPVHLVQALYVLGDQVSLLGRWSESRSHRTLDPVGSKGSRLPCLRGFVVAIEEEERWWEETWL